MPYYEHARLELLIKCLVNFIPCTGDILTATSSNIATSYILGVECKTTSSYYGGWLKKEDTYRTVGFCRFALQVPACMCYAEIERKHVR